MPTDTTRRGTTVRTSVKGKMIKDLFDDAPDLRIVFTDGTVLKIEALACGDLRYSYEARPDTDPDRAQQRR